MSSTESIASADFVSRQPKGLPPKRVTDAALLLIQARAERRLMTPPFAIPEVEDAYAVQDSVLAALGPAGAWKVGAKSPDAQPTCAPIFASILMAAPAEIPAAHLGMIGIEAEIAFTLAADIEPGGPALTESDFPALIAAAHPAIEVVDTRVADWKNADRLWLLADNQMNGALVVGDPAKSPHLDLKALSVTLRVDGKVAIEAIGGNTAGDPRRVLLWLLNHCRANGIALKRGMPITTGSCTGMTFVHPGARVTAEFAGFGAVAVQFPT
jgi:2-keto-4-pentenoate hydratase